MKTVVFPEHCGAGEVIAISAWDGDDYVALLASDPGGGGVATDRAAVGVYEDIVAVCRDAAEDYPLSVDGDFATAAELYDYCVRAEIDLGEGQNEAHGTSGPEWMTGGSETDVLFGDGGCDVLAGGDGNDVIECGSSAAPVCDSGSAANSCTADGGGDEDHIIGSNGKDHLYGDWGADFIDGGAGDDEIQGEKGNDFLFGSYGHDVLHGGYGDDLLSGGTDQDEIHGDGEDTTTGDVFYCRDASHADPVHDHMNARLELVFPETDCLDSSHWGLETMEEPDPYVDWARRFNHVVQIDNGGRSIFNTFDTTSSRELMLDAWLGGASILMQEGGAIPLGGHFCETGCPYPARDGVVYFLPADAEWLFDHDLDGTLDDVIVGFGTRQSRPFAGDFDGDGVTDIGYFDPAKLEAYVDLSDDGDGLNGAADRTYPLPKFLAGDLPVAGRFDASEANAQLAFFRPWTRQWIIAEESGTPVVLSAMTGETEPGAMPLAVDVDCDGVDDPAVFDRHLQDVWEYWDIGDHEHDTVEWHGGHAREYPIAGDFGAGGSSCRNDIGLVDPSTRDVVVRYDGMTATGSEWQVDLAGTVPPDAGIEADPLHARRIQSPLTCGPGSLEMVFRYVGITEEVGAGQLAFTRDLNTPTPPTPVVIPSWSPTAGLVSVGYWYSIEYIMYDAYREWYLYHYYDWPPQTGGPYVEVGAPRLLMNTAHVNQLYSADWFRMDYDVGYAEPGVSGIGHTIQLWAMEGPGVGMEIEDGDRQPATLGRRLPGVANRANDARGRHYDARPVHVSDIDYYREIIRGFIDHGIPLLVGVNQGHHFNAVIGYWELPSGAFYVYTADPADGGGWWNYPDKAMRWQRFLLAQDVIDADLLGGPMLFNHSDEGCVPGAWADTIDDQFMAPGTGLLCGYARAL